MTPYEHESPLSSILRTVITIAGIWLLASVAYTLIAPSITSSTALYYSHPVGTVLYYAGWILVSLYMFWPIIKTVPVSRKHVWMYGFFALGMLGVAWFFVEFLPSISMNIPPDKAIDMDLNIYPIAGSPGYFVSKAFEILLQQLLMVVLIKVLAHRYRDLTTLSWHFALSFGLAHFLLYFQYTDPTYATLYIAAASFSSLWMPYFILRVPNGFLLTYFLHWGFYIALALIARMIV